MISKLHHANNNKAAYFLLLTLSTVYGKVLQYDEEAEMCGYQACTKANLDQFNVHLVSHSHDDVGWLKTVDGYFYEDVQNVISTVVTALKLNPDRRFIQVETAFFKRWWDNQPEKIKEDVKKLINNGQLEMTNGAWSMNDEGAVNYQSTIDQFTFALKYLQDNLGKCSRPKIGWQIDPFGHSREQASIYAQMGFDGFFFARLDLRDRETRENSRTQDMLWRGSASLGNTSDIFTSVVYKHYSFPSGFCFDYECNDDPIITDEESPDYNHEQRVKDFADYIRKQAATYPTNNILIAMGDDVRYQASFINFLNIDRLIEGFTLFPQQVDDRTINVFYSTPTCYVKAVNDYVKANDVTLQMVTDDFFPYATSLNGYFTGYFTSRPTCKKYERQGNNLLQVSKQLAVTAAAAIGSQEDNIFPLKDAMGVYQHHDAITGTERQHVADSYRKFLSIGLTKATEASNAAISYLLNPDESGFDLELKSCLLSNVSYCEQTKSADKFLVVLYNPLSRSISHHVSVPVDSQDWEITDPSGNSIVYQITDSIKDFSYISDITYSPYNLVFNAENLNPLGLHVYSFEKVDSLSTNKVSSRSRIVIPTAGTQIGYDDHYIVLNEDTGLLESVTMNGVTLDVSQELLYYESDPIDSNAYLFLPAADKDPVKMSDGNVNAQIIEGDLFYEVIQEYNSFGKQVIRIYKNEPTFIELDWIVGPIDLSDGIGKEIISRFTTPLATNATFFTDSNGREMLQRIRNYRATYEYTNEQPITGNYYPVTSRIVLKENGNDVEFAVLNDRAQGGGSINDGQVELMMHRYCIAKDSTGEALQEVQYDQNLVVRGQHYLTIGSKNGNGKSAAAIRRDIAQRKLLAPWTFVTNKDITLTDLKNRQVSLITRELEENVQILTLENWDDSVVLLRLEHLLEVNEDENLSQDVTVDLTDLFATFTITELQETTLSGTVPLDESERLDWPQSSNKHGADSSLNFKANLKRDVTDLKIKLAPMQIRTFLATVQYNI